MSTVTTASRRQGRGGRERILAAAAGLFATQGINATGMEQIAERAPVSKRTLYAHFRTKDELVLAHLKDLASTGRTLESALAREDVPARERILALFDPPPTGTDPVRGCPFIDAAVEFPDPQNAVHSYARDRKLLMVRLVVDLVTELGCREPAVLAEQLVTLADGAASRAMVLGEANYGRHARTAAEVLLANALPATDGRPGAPIREVRS